MTPRLLLALLRAQEEVEHRKDLRAGLVAAQIINVNLKKGTPPVSASDFFGAQDEEEDCEVEGIIAVFRGLKPGRN